MNPYHHLGLALLGAAMAITAARRGTCSREACSLPTKWSCAARSATGLRTRSPTQEIANMTTHHEFSHSATRSREQVARMAALAEAHLSREDDPLEHDDYKEMFHLYAATFCSLVVGFLVMFS